MQENKLQGKPAPPDTKSWFEYSWKLKQDVPNRYEDAAKFLATIISLTITIIFASYEKLQLIVFQFTPKPDAKVSYLLFRVNKNYSISS